MYSSIILGYLVISLTLCSSPNNSPVSCCCSCSNRDIQCPVSVYHSPVSSCRSSTVGCSTTSSCPMRVTSGDVSLFSGWNTYVEYDSSSLKSDSVLIDKLTFNMDLYHATVVCGGGYDIEPYAKELFLGAQMRHKILFDDFVIEAFYEAEKAHRGQTRASGDPYLQHCVETGLLLASICVNSTVVAAGLLLDTFDDSFLSCDYIAATFGAGGADLVQGVSKLSHLSKLARDNDTACRTDEADRLHSMFLAMEDARAVLIKLADRLHNMLTLEALPLVKQQRLAMETMEIFVPLASRLGIYSWKEQLENLCFKRLNPDQHKQLPSKLAESFDEAMITSAIEKLEQALNDKAMPYHDLSGRYKSVYSIYRKMLKKKRAMDQIHDIHGLHLIVETEEDCYKALGIVCQLWPEVDGKYKGYVTYPKFNGYQSIHTVVKGEGVAPLEVQIRTKQMHLQADFGFAAHWRYKESGSKNSLCVLQMVEWARLVISRHCEAMSGKQSSIGYTSNTPCKFPNHSDDCLFPYKPHCHKNYSV